MKGKMPRTKFPKLRAWAQPTRKIMTMVIPTEKDKQRERAKKKEAERKEIEKELKENKGT
ncbi:MAG: hypothetical protein PHG97_05445 [Candidatus Margulisbacteria bacterium]|nr:hypothetical protein [Candidatus Margulisiibacteriota bacterium]